MSPLVQEEHIDLVTKKDLARVETFTAEQFLHEGEEICDVLAPGSARRAAFDSALKELGEGNKYPSTSWRRRYSLMLGLERILADEEPRLADDTVLNPHQVDALSGTLTALIAERQQSQNVHEVDLASSQEQEKPEQQAGTEVFDHAEVQEDEDLDSSELVDSEPDPEEDLLADDEEEDIDEEGAGEEANTEELSWYEDEAHAEDADEEQQLEEQPDDPNAAKRFWFEHATGAGKTVAALGFVEASRAGGVLILTHRRNLVEQFLGELHDRGYGKRISKPLMQGEDPIGAGKAAAGGPVTVETYQWFVRHAGQISSAYTVVICDEAHTALGEKTSAAIREWTGPIFVGMTATGALIARHVTDLFPTQTSRFDLAQAARRGVIAPLRCVRIPPGPGVRTIAKVPLRRGEVDVEFDQELLAELLDQTPFNAAIAGLYKSRFNNIPGVVYAAGVKHAYNVAKAFRGEGIKAQAVSGETPKRELTKILARYERGEIDVLVNAQLLAEGWNSPRATVCMHLAPTASRRIYQQRVGRVTRRQEGKESGIVVDFVHPATKNDDPVVTLHSLLNRDVYRGGAIVVGPVRRNRNRKVRVERRVIPVAADEDRRIMIFERELWRIAVDLLPYGEQVQWAALAGARIAPNGWRKARSIVQFSNHPELQHTFLLTAVQRNRHPEIRYRAIRDIAVARDAEAFDLAVDELVGWQKNERRLAVRVALKEISDRRIGRLDQATAWIWRLAFYTRDLHEAFAIHKSPEAKELLEQLAKSSGPAHTRYAKQLVQLTRDMDRRLAASVLASAVAHFSDAEEVLRYERTRMARKPNMLARELARNLPKLNTKKFAQQKPSKTKKRPTQNKKRYHQRRKSVQEDGQGKG